MWLRSGCDVNQGRSCVASDFMRNASNGQCKTGAVEWQVAVTNSENRIPKNAIMELLFDIQSSSECSKTFFRIIPDIVLSRVVRYTSELLVFF